MVRIRRSLCVALAGAWIAAACSFDWDAYDPRLGGSPDASAGAGGTSLGGSSGAAGSATGGSSGSTGGSSGASGSGGSAGSAGSTGGSAGSTGGSAGSTGGSAGSTGGSAGDAGVLTSTYNAGVAECISLSMPDPDACETATGAGLMSVDAQNSALPANPETAAFLSFSLDGAFAGKQVLSVTLEITVSGGVNANSNASGEVWEVASFTLASLSTTVPAKQGAAAIAPDQGAVTQNQVVAWSLPASVVTAGQTLYLGVFPTANDGIDYIASGAGAPTLTVQYQ